MMDRLTMKARCFCPSYYFLGFLTLSYLGSLVSDRQTSSIIWAANLKFWCEVALGGPLHWSVPSRHLADHPDSDGQCFGLSLMQKRPLIYPFVATTSDIIPHNLHLKFLECSSQSTEEAWQEFMERLTHLTHVFDVAPVWKMMSEVQLNVHALAK